MPSTLLLAQVKLAFHWGFWVRVPHVSARQETYILPPPSTLLGTLAAGIAFAVRDLNGVHIPETRVAPNGSIEVPLPKVIVEKHAIKEIFFRVLERYGIRRTDISRQFQGPYVRKVNLEKDRSQWFAVRTVGKVYSPLLVCEVAYLVDPSALLEALNHFKVNIPNINKLLLASLLSISRVGPVEGIVTVCEARVLPVEVIKYERGLKLPAEPCPYFACPPDIVDEGEVCIVTFFDWRDPNFWTSNRTCRELRYAVPIDSWYLNAGILAPFKPYSMLERALERVGKFVRAVKGDGIEHETIYPIRDI